MSEQNVTILDELLASYRFDCQRKAIKATPDELAHIFGAQEPVRSQPDSRARTLVQLGWLHIEYIDISLPLDERGKLVSAIQEHAHDWLKKNSSQPEEVQQQVRWLISRTRGVESPQQIVHRVWLTAVLYNLGMRGLAFNEEGQILYQGGQTARIGYAPDPAIELIRQTPRPVLYTASFRQPDGAIWRGKGRQRWYVYCVTLDPASRVLFERERPIVREKVALIVASDTHAKRPQLPRDFYGGDAFQQACIDAQDQQFTHILVLSPKHGVLSLDDVVTSDDLWEHVAESRRWDWGYQALQRLGLYLYGSVPPEIKEPHKVNWWAWLNPRSTYELTFFGSGFPVHALINQVRLMRSQDPYPQPTLEINSLRPGYKAIETEPFSAFDRFGLEEEEPDFEAELQQDLENLLGWATEFAEHVNVSFPPTGDEWALIPEEAIIPARLLALNSTDVDELLDLLSDISLTLERPVSIHLLLNARAGVQTLLQVIHSLVHHDHQNVRETLNEVPETTLARYIETALQQPKEEDRLCSLLTLAESLCMLSVLISDQLNQQLMVWLQTYLAGALQQHMRRQTGGNGDRT